VDEESPGQASWMLAGLAPGSVVGGYRIESRLGVGGMAVVFQARDEGLDRVVALKVLAPGLAGDAEFRERFIRESRTAARVDHPHIIPVHGAGESDGVLYLAMRFVPGGDLRSVIAREGPLTGERAAFLLSPIASALDSAHAAGLVHRDVKPANILIDASPGRPDHPYLSDFGLAKGTASTTGLTGTGQFFGTPDYAAPEQISGQPTSARADQYALACVAFTALTGALPFARDTSLAVLWAHVYDPPPMVNARRRDLPAGVDDVLARALAKAPGERYRTCGEFIDALRAALALTSYANSGPGVTGGRSVAVSAAGERQAPVESGSPPPTPAQTVAPHPSFPPATQQGLPQWHLPSEPGPAVSSRGGSARRRQPLPPDGGGQEPFPRRRPPRRRLAYVLAALAVVAGLGGGGGWWLAAGRYTTVPAVGRLTAAGAGQALRQAGFQVRTGAPVVDDNVPKGDVVSFSPSARALPGSAVTLTLSQGPRTIDVPQIPSGDTVAQAEAALRAAGLTVASATRQVGAASDPVIGAVAGSTPAAGTSWAENKPVIIEVVAGLALPNLVGQDIGTIEKWAAQNRVNVQPTQVSSGQPQGTVVAQSLAPGTPVRPGRTVSLSVSGGPSIVPVPDVQGRTCQEAQQELQQAGFSVDVQQGPFHADNATSVNPAGKAPSGATVTLECGSSAAF
jgi:serine/threonine protein kinase/beta-lactam-binding protein with PASTA domain